MEVAGLLITETEFTELLDEIVIELTALFDTLTEFLESLDDTVMEVAGLLDTETKFTNLLVTYTSLMVHCYWKVP